MKKIRLISVLLLVFLFLLIPLSVQAASNVAILTVFSDPSSSPIDLSSGLSYDAGTHSWITVKNIASTPIAVGALDGIAPGTTVSVGTWSDTRTTEHNGIWYNLEAQRIYNSAYSGRVSRSYYLTATQLYTLNKNIKNNDWWYKLKPCSYWACMQWNGVASPRLSSGFPSTPIKLAASIKATPGWTASADVPYDYAVYYANGAGTPIQSEIIY